MSNIQETADWIEGIYQLEMDDPVEGGPDGIDNLQAKQLAARTRWLRQALEDVDLAMLVKSAKSSTAQAQAGDDDATYMTPLKVAQAITALATVAAASEFIVGKVRLATTAETAAGVSTALATHPAGVMALVNAKVAALVNSSPAALDTLNELATALGNDPNFATTINNAIGQKLATSAKSSTAQAQAGADDATYMTPLKVSQAIAALATVVAASEAVAGKVRLATAAETAAGASNSIATHPAGVLALVNAKVAALINSSPAALDTLNELATALGNDPNFAATMTAALAGKAPKTGEGTSGNWPINVTGTAGGVAWGNVSGKPSLAYNDGGTYGIHISGRGYPRRSDGGDLNFAWSGQGGQPTWLWGGNDGNNMYVYNPSNFSVSYANSAGNADTVDGWHRDDLRAWGNITGKPGVASGDAGANSVGAIAIALYNGPSVAITAGSTYAGSSLRGCGMLVAGTAANVLMTDGSNQPLAGTWRAMCSANYVSAGNYAVAIFQRIA